MKDCAQLPIKDFAQIPKRLRLTIYKLHLAITDKNNIWFLSVVEGPHFFSCLCEREWDFFEFDYLVRLLN